MKHLKSAVLIAAIIAFFGYASFFTPMGILGLAAVAVSEKKSDLSKALL